MFDPDRLYVPTDAELRPIAKEQTLARWRCEGVGPAFVKCGARVVYRGGDLNAWIEARLVPTRAATERTKTVA